MTPKSNKVPLLGAHLSIAGGTPRAIERGVEVGCSTLQIFVKNNNQWTGKTISQEEAEEFRRKRQSSKLDPIIAHSSYLINLASPQETLWERSIKAMVDELERCSLLGLDALVTHPGAHVGEGEAFGVSRIATALNRIHQALPGSEVPIALETTAGQGSSIGHRFEHLRDILDGCFDPGRIAICLDTCHVFAAGYDFRSHQGYQSMMDRFDRQVGLDRLRVIHMNDSKKELGSRVDRHEHIGKGSIGLDGFRWIMRDPRLESIPKVLETPKGEDHESDRRNLRILRRLARG